MADGGKPGEQAPEQTEQTPEPQEQPWVPFRMRGGLRQRPGKSREDEPDEDS
jgi:hypothetical protein